jgi:putative ABC transport system permease protein
MLLAEALVLGGAATLLAVFVTWLALDTLTPLIQQQLGRTVPRGVSAVAIDARLLLIATALGVVTALSCTVAPLLTSLRPRLLGALQNGGRTATEGRRSQRIRATLIAFEVAASVTLVAGSTLMLRSVITLLQTDLGFNGERILNASVTLRANRYPDAQSRLAVLERTSARLSAIAGAESVAMVTGWPLQQGRLQPVAAADASERTATRAAVQGVSDAYFSTLDIPIVAGRAFTSADRVGAEPVAVVSETLARRLWPAGNALHSRVVVPQAPDGARLIVGIVKDVRQLPVDEDLADVYVPILQAPPRSVFVLMRTAGAPSNWIAPLRAAFREIDPEIAAPEGRPLQAGIDNATARPRFLVLLLGTFAAAAVLLALVGVYGVVAYAVRQREREIAVRLAIGANPVQITRLFLSQGGAVLLTGLMLGVFGALAAGRLLESQLVGITPADPVALAAAVMAFATAGLFAIWWPSHHAAATDPAIALRFE